MAKIHESGVIAAPVERVWEYVRDFNSLPKWFPGVTDSHLEPGPATGQAGCVRDFGLEGGARIRERLLEFSDQDHVCRYTMIECPLPIVGYVATLKLTASGGGTLAELVSQFEVPPAQEKEIVGMLTTTYRGAFELLKKHFG